MMPLRANPPHAIRFAARLLGLLLLFCPPATAEEHIGVATDNADVLRAPASFASPAGRRVDEDEEGDEEEIWELPDEGYAEELESVAFKQKTVSGLRVSVAVVPAYRYLMARGFDELAKGFYSGEVLKEKLKKLHLEHKTHKTNQRSLFLVSLSGGHKGLYFFFQSDPKRSAKKNFELKVRSKKSLNVTKVEPPIEPSIWSCYEYPPNAKRKYRPRVPLWHIQNQKIALSGTPLKKTSKKRQSEEPFTFSLHNILRVEKTGNPREGINPQVRQISCTEWRQLVLPKVEFTFYPARMEQPPAPDGFDELLELIDKKF